MECYLYSFGYDWEVDVLASFYTLHSRKMRREGEDKLWWVLSHLRKFDVRSFYKILACKEVVSFPWKSIWWDLGSLEIRRLRMVGSSR
jgi:hypothetical protein